MLKQFNRNTLVFSSIDVAHRFTQNSLIAKRLPLETFTISGENATIVYATWDTLTEDEKQDTIFYPDIVTKTFDAPYTDYGTCLACQECRFNRAEYELDFIMVNGKPGHLLLCPSCTDNLKTHVYPYGLVLPLTSTVIAIRVCQVGLCHKPTQHSCMCCHRPACFDCGTIEMENMGTQREGLFCNDCWLDYAEALRIADIKAHVLSDVYLVQLGTMSEEQCISYAQGYLSTQIVTSEQASKMIQTLKDALYPPHTHVEKFGTSLDVYTPGSLQESMRYSEVSELVYHAVECLKDEDMPLSIRAIHTAMNKKASLAEIREIVNEEYPPMPEDTSVCSGCLGKWCFGCDPR